MSKATCPKCGATASAPGVVTLTSCFCGWRASPVKRPNTKHLRLVDPPSRNQASTQVDSGA